MTQPPTDPFAALERAFHEPKRLALMSALIGSPDQEMTFNELKAACELTDGNLNRHLRALEEIGAVAFRKRAGPGRSQTVVSLTTPGRQAFIDYLAVLETVLKTAAAAAARALREPAVHPLLNTHPARG